MLGIVLLVFVGLLLFGLLALGIIVCLPVAFECINDALEEVEKMKEKRKKK